MPLTYGMDKPGPMCLTADDCGLVLNAVAGHDERDEATATRPYEYRPHRPEGGRFRLGVPRGVPDGSQPGVRDRFREALDTLAEVADVEVVELPKPALRRSVERDLPGRIGQRDGGDHRQRHHRGAHRTGGAHRDLPPHRDAGHGHYLRALRLRRTIAVAADRLLACYDALLSPTRPTVAPPADRPWVKKSGERAADPLGAFGSCVGLPAISVPMGFADDGLPIGLQILGRAYDENVVLAVASAYQELTDWHARHPQDLLQGIATD